MGFDALLVASFGGPEGPDEVRPFLENVTRGRGVPPDRMDAVVRHYLHFGGISPINALNRALVAALRRELAGLPVYFGNRNWHPFVEDTVATMAADGVRRALMLATSAYGGYSACRQYHEDIARARAATGRRAPHLVKLRHFFDHPLFVEANADAVRAAFDELPAELREDARLVFTAHSVPIAVDATGGPVGQGGHLYSRQVTEAARLVAAAVGVCGPDVVWQSRSGPPTVPWLVPDIVDHLGTLHAGGTRAVVVSPVGFVSDHLEVVWDLDVEARARAAELGMAFARAATAGADPRFVRLVVDLVAEQTEDAAPRAPSALASYGAGCDGELCTPACCEPPRRPGGRGPSVE